MRPGVRLAVLSVATSIVTAVLTVYAAAAWVQRGSEENRRVTCELVAAQLAAYQEVPPTTPAGRNIVTAWEQEYRILGC